jgi:hypothetical protein
MGVRKTAASVKNGHGAAAGLGPKGNRQFRAQASRTKVTFMFTR